MFDPLRLTRASTRVSMFVPFSGHALNRQPLGKPENRLGRTDTKAAAAETWILGSSPSKTKEGQALTCDACRRPLLTLRIVVLYTYISFIARNAPVVSGREKWGHL